jgi:hypothetical protein
MGEFMSIASWRVAAGIGWCLVPLLFEAAGAQQFQTTLKIAPEGGGNCISLVSREAVQGEGLQMQDCENAPGQIFTRDQAKDRIMIGGLCVDANGGGPGDLVKLATCDSAVGQAWKLERKGDFVKFIGVKGLCLDIRYGSKDRGAPLQSWTCEDTAPNQLWGLQQK